MGKLVVVDIINIPLSFAPRIVLAEARWAEEDGYRVVVTRNQTHRVLQLLKEA